MIPILQDDLVEGDETLRLTLSAVRGNHGLGIQSTCRVAILDDEASFVADPAFLILDERGGAAEVTVEFAGPLAEGSAEQFTLVVGMKGDTATPVADVEVTPATLIFSATTRRQTFRVRALPGGGSETDETARIGIGNAIVALRILDDERSGSSAHVAVANGNVISLTALASGGAMVTGDFTQIGEATRTGLARLKGDGSVDADFTPPAFSNSRVSTVGVPPAKMMCATRLPNGDWIVGGIIGLANGVPVRNLVRLHPDGSLDPTFPLLRTGASTPVDCVAVLPDGRAYLGGYFETIGGRPYKRLARLKADGSVDTTFRSVQPNGEILEILPLPNGQVLVGGGFTVIAGANRRFVALFNQDGALDDSFDLGRGAGDQVWALAAGGDGSLYVGGALRSFNDRPASYLARVRLPQIYGSSVQAERSADGSLRSRVHGLSGARYPVESSVNLQDWQPAGEVHVDGWGNSAEFTAPAEDNARFFRLKIANR